MPIKKKKKKKPQKPKFNPKYDYIEDMDNLNRFEILLTIPADPIWYRVILTFICLEVFYIFHEPMIYHNELKSVSQQNIRVIEIVFNFMYFIDILLTIMVQNMKNLPILSSRLIWRPWPIIICDLISTMPFELAIHVTDTYTNKMYYAMKLMHTLKVVRLFHHFHMNKYELQSVYTTRLIEFVIILALSQSVFVVMFYMVYCFKNDCTRDTYCTIYEIISTKMNGKGSVVTFVPFYEMGIWTHDLPVIVGILVLHMLVQMPMVCYMISGLICEYEHKIYYIYKVNFFKKRLVQRYGMSEATCKSVIDYFEAYWKHRGGFTKKEIDDIMSVYSCSMQIEMAMDYGWTAFRHSGLFRGRDVSFLRFLTTLMKIELHMPGELLFERNVMKNRMIYISEGTVEVLSNENAKCGIFSLTSGSCLGETTLVIPYKSIVNFRCQTVCKVYVLSKFDFMLISKKYPVIYRNLLQQVWERYAEAKALYEVKMENVTNRSMDLVRLKTTLHGLMCQDVKFKDDHQIKNIYLARDICYTYMNQLWNTRKYLDLLVLKGRSESKHDSVFIKTTGIWILRPNSPILNVWEYFIVMLTIACTILIPYGICKHASATTSAIMVVIQWVWIFDLLIQIIIPINDHSRARSIKSIFSERFQTTLFILDVVSVFPGGVFIILVNSDFSNDYFELNKFAKLYRMKKLFDAWESHFKINILYVRFIKYFVLFSIEIYLISCIFVMVGIVPNLFSSVSIQFSSGVGFFSIKGAIKQSFVYMISNNAALIMELLAFVSITSAFYLSYMTKLKVSNFIDNLYACVRKKVKDEEILQRLESFINTQLNENQGMMVVTNFKAYFDLPVYFDIMTKSEYHLKYLLQLDIFAGVPFEILQKLTTSTTMMTFHKHANIVNRGVIYSSVYVLIDGTCRTICGQLIYFTKPRMPINMLEISCETPAVCTVVGLTEVLVLTFSYTHLLSLLKSENARLFDVMQQTLIVRKEQTRRKLVKILKGRRAYFVQKRDDRTRSFYRFQDRFIPDSYAEFDYFVPFDKFHPFSWIRFFLMPLTIYPEGTFLFYWDLARSTLAFVAGISYMILPISIKVTNYSYLFFYALDVTVFLDMYVRMHVCYYNKVGILIKHPLYTAAHYAKNGLLGDLIGAIPFNLININCIFCKTLLHLIRSVQMHRIIGFKCAYHKNTLPANMVFALVWTIFIINTIASFLFASLCSLNNYNITCTYGRRPLHLYTYLVFMVTSIITTTGMEGRKSFIADHGGINVVVSILSVTAIFMKISINGFLLSSYLKKDMEIYNFRTGIAHLYNVMKHEKSSKYMKAQIGIYYNIYWRRVGENNPFDYFKNLNNSLKRDLLYSFYGEQLVRYSIFPSDSKQLEDLYKNFLLQMQPLIIPRDGYVITINDIEDNVYFLYSGDVEVVAADGTCMQKLNEGSLFGNLENTDEIRQKISIVANTHVHMFSLKTTKFYGIIEYFPEIKENFLLQKAKYNYYIKSSLDVSNPPPAGLILKKAIKHYRKFRIFQLLYQPTLFFGLLMEIYQVAVLEVHPFYLLVQYIFDVLHIIHEVWKFFVGYLDENQDLVIDVKLIRARYLKKIVLSITVISCIPFDLPVLFIAQLNPTSLNKYDFLITMLRLNRVLRIYNIITLEKYRKANLINPANMLRKLIFLTYFILLAAFSGACILMLFDRYIDDGGLYLTKMDGEQKVMRKISIDLRPDNKFYLFIKYLYFNIAIFIFTNDENYMSTSSVKTILIIFYMLFWVVFQVIIFAELMKMSSEYSHERFGMLNVIKFYEHYSGLKNTSNIIKKKMYRTLVNIWSYTHNRNIKILVKNCPRYLQQAVLYSIYGHVLYNNPVFHHTHIDFLRQLIGKTNLVCFFVNDIIVYKNDDRETIYFIHRGKVAVLHDESQYNEQAIEILEAGDCFGLLQGLYVNKVYDYTYRSITTCEVVKLELKKWAHLLDFFPATREFIYSTAPQYENCSSCRRIPKKT